MPDNYYQLPQGQQDDTQQGQDKTDPQLDLPRGFVPYRRNSQSITQYLSPAHGTLPSQPNPQQSPDSPAHANVPYYPAQHAYQTEHPSSIHLPSPIGMMRGEPIHAYPAQPPHMQLPPRYPISASGAPPPSSYGAHMPPPVGAIQADMKGKSPVEVMYRERNQIPILRHLAEPGIPQSEIKYELVVIQQPLRARMCGFGGRDRRLVDPPPIVQLIARHLPTNRIIEQSVTDPPLLIVHAALYNASGDNPNMIIRTPRGKKQSTLMNSLTGSLVSSAFSLVNLSGRQGVYFIFADLSVRVEGTFRMCFKLGSVASPDSLSPPGCLVSTDSTAVIAQVLSSPFTVYTAKEFPGMLASTPLTKCFAQQGVRVPIRGERRKNMKTVEDVMNAAGAPPSAEADVVEGEDEEGDADGVGEEAAEE